MSSKCESNDFSIVWVVDYFYTDPVKERRELQLYMISIFLLDLIRWHFFLLVPGSLVLFTSAYASSGKLKSLQTTHTFRPPHPLENGYSKH